MNLCKYGCGKQAKYQLKNNSWCCSKYHAQCTTVRRKSANNNARYWKEKKRSKKTRKKIKENNVKYWLGKKRNKQSEIMIGENNPNWKGGIDCEPYCDIWLDKEYKDSIKKRDGNKCLNPDCWRTSEIICLHHINYNKKDCHPLNLISVCNSCNARSNKDREWHQYWYEAIIYRRYYNERRILYRQG